MTDWKETNRLCALREQAAPEKPLRAKTLRRLLTNIDEFAKSRHADGLTNSSLDGALSANKTAHKHNETSPVVDNSIPPDWNRWLHVLSNINYDPATGVAPHKPLLLLVVCDLVEEGKLGGAILRRSGDLVFRFSSYWKIVAERRRTKPDVRLPFFHLRTEGVWKPLEADGRPAEYRNRAVLAQIDVSFLMCLTDVVFRTLARRTLIAKYFQPHERAELYNLLKLDIPPDEQRTRLVFFKPKNPQ